MSRTARFVGQQTKCRVIGLGSRKVKDIRLWLAVWKNSLNLPTADSDKIQMLCASKMKDIPFSSKTGHSLFNKGASKCWGRRLMWLGAYIFEKSIKRHKKRQIHDYRVLQCMRERLVDPNKPGDLSEEDNRIKAVLKYE